MPSGMAGCDEQATFHRVYLSFWPEIQGASDDHSGQRYREPRMTILARDTGGLG